MKIDWSKEVLYSDLNRACLTYEKALNRIAAKWSIIETGAPILHITAQQAYNECANIAMEGLKDEG